LLHAISVFGSLLCLRDDSFATAANYVMFPFWPAHAWLTMFDTNKPANVLLPKANYRQAGTSSRWESFAQVLPKAGLRDVKCGLATYFRFSAAAARLQRI